VTTVLSAASNTYLSLLPSVIAEAVADATRSERRPPREIRLRTGHPLEIVGLSVASGLIVTADHVRHVLATVTGSSLHAVEQDIRSGFVTAPGGHRVGLAGRAVLGGDGRVRTLRDIASVNIRVAQAVMGSAEPLVPYLIGADRRIVSGLLVGAPMTGKTTLLRDAARLLSHGLVTRLGGVHVVIVDERSEIAGCFEGVAQFDVGPATDVLDACPKVEGLNMAVRSLSPHVIVTDELGSLGDVQAVLEAARAGVSILGSVHAKSWADLQSRPAMRDLLASGAIQRLFFLDSHGPPGRLLRATDSLGRAVLPVCP